MDNENIINKFLKQSFENDNKNFKYFVNKESVRIWDYVVITASNQKQADYYNKQIQIRLQKKIIPSQTEYIVCPDLNDKRIGSGGATLNVFSKLYESDKTFFNKKILLIHSGGDSKRVPQYSVCGKLFSPVPRTFNNNFRVTLFDEILITTCNVASRMKHGTLIVPGDTEFLFNSLQLDFDGCDAAALSLKESLDIGKDHGVFLVDDDKIVRKFLHKFSPDKLKKNGAVDRNDLVNLDTGFIWMSNHLVKSLFELLIDDDGNISKKLVDKYVNDFVRLSFYADFIYPLGIESTIEDYFKEVPENDYSDDLVECRKSIWAKISHFKLKVLTLSPARYVHFGTTHELLSLMSNKINNYNYLNWNKKIMSYSCYETPMSLSFVDNESVVSNMTYIEDSIVNKCVIGNNSIISSTNITNLTIPDDVVINSLKLVNGKYVTRIYGVNDNPKATFDGEFLKSSIRFFAKIVGLNPMSLSSKVNKTIWDAEIYPECNTLDEANNYALFIYNASLGKVDQKVLPNYLKLKKYSMATSFANADTNYLLECQSKLANKFIFSNLISKIEDCHDLMELIDFLDVKLLGDFIDFISDKNLGYLTRSRCYMYISLLLNKYNLKNKCNDGQYYLDLCYSNISDEIVKEHFKIYPRTLDKLVYNGNIDVELPVRVNFCGSPSDAAPYCLEYGGAQFNASIILDNKMPISVKINKLQEKVIKLKSIDLNCSTTITNLNDLKKFNDPFDNFALFKATLFASGLFDYEKFKSFEDFIDDLGLGFEIISHVDVPKGSGLGTSSILVAAILKALGLFFGKNFSEQKIYSQVFVTEQLMTTGGGWQDQVGGLTPGLKMIITKPGKNQYINCEYVNLDDSVKEELSKRFVLIFSGQRRLARNVLRNEMSTLFINNKEANDVLDRIQEICSLMKYELIKGNVTNFAKYITKQFELVKKIDSGASNECIEFIFDYIDDLIDGKSICGAGGGGFLMCVLKDKVTVQELEERINSAFHDCGVKVWNSKLLW